MFYCTITKAVFSWKCGINIKLFVLKVDAEADLKDMEVLARSLAIFLFLIRVEN